MHCRYHVLVLGVLLSMACHEKELKPVMTSEPAFHSPSGSVTNDSRGTWLARRPSQCSPNDPWRADWIAGHNGDAHYPQGADEISNILDFCSKHRVLVIDSLYRYEPITACAACTCPGNYVAYLLVDESDVGTVESFGFQPQQP